MSTGRVRTVLKWVGTGLCLLLVAAFPYSVLNTISWDSATARLSVSLVRGGLWVSWWAEDFDLAPLEYGWRVGKFGGSIFTWWFRVARTEGWTSLEIPLWAPFIVIAVPTALLWYRDRGGTTAFVRRWLARLTPPRRQRITFTTYAAFALAHLAGILPTLFVVVFGYHLFVLYSTPAFDRFMDVFMAVLLWGTPAYALLWAWLWARLRNRLWARHRGSRCDCGYDLTGNVSGRCPECGRAAAAAVHAGAPQVKPSVRPRGQAGVSRGPSRGSGRG